ncbi:Sensor protein VraS [Hydrogenophaga sp. T4]|nr:Sensor protein VraS [Hydrogenophaga sp. T4]
MSKSTAADRRGLNEVLAELRQRVQHRLGHGGIQLVWDVDPALPAVAGRETSQHLRALLSEAIANVIKHAQATQIRLEAREEDGAVVIAVTDNGRGFDPVSAEFGRGLPGMRQRAETLGALLEIESDAKRGADGCCGFRCPRHRRPSPRERHDPIQAGWARDQPAPSFRA